MRDIFICQRDKDLFLRNSFVVVKTYFQNALQELSHQYQEVETDFAEVHNFKFLSTIYVRGEVANKCKIWIGGLSSSDSIAYQQPVGELSEPPIKWPPAQPLYAVFGSLSDRLLGWSVCNRERELV